MSRRPLPETSLPGLTRQSIIEKTSLWNMDTRVKPAYDRLEKKPED
jgi:hypothetical protein